MNNPTQCILWKEPERINQHNWMDGFELVERIADENHLERRIIKCRECGQLYFYEWYEVINFVDGEDPTYTTLIPLAKINGADEMRNVSPMELLRFKPRLQKDYPSYADRPLPAYWNPPSG